MTVIDLEARKARRNKSLDMGLIRFGDLSICCSIRNVSSGGIALDLGTTIDIPNQFTLIVIAQKKTYSCNVVWRKGRRIGVALI